MLIALSIAAIFFTVPNGARLVYAWPFDQWCLFAIGLCLAEWQTQRHPAALLVAVLASCDLVFNRPEAVAIVGLLTAVTATGCMSAYDRFLNKERFISALGVWSYGLYLIHVPIGCWLALRIADRFSHRSLSWHIACDLAILGFLIICSYFFYHLIERRSTQMGMALISRYRRKLIALETLS